MEGVRKGRDVVAEEMKREGVNGERGMVGWVGSHPNPMTFLWDMV